MSDAPKQRRIVVIGGGISGLAAAHRLLELGGDREIVLLEATDRLGGILQTSERDGFLIERSADSFTTTLPWAIDLCRRIGMADELIPTNESRRRALVVRRGRLYHVPDGFVLMAPRRWLPIVASPLLSPLGKLRLLGEFLVPRRPDEVADESLASFARRRLGREAFERLVQPLVSGIFTADPDKLSMAAALPQFFRMEREHGSLTRAAHRQSVAESEAAESGARYSLFVAPRRGMSSLIATLTGRLPAGVVRLNQPVERIERTSHGEWRLDCGPLGALLCDGLIVATPAPAAARLLQFVDATLAAELNRIEHADSAVVSLGYRREQIGRPLDGFGFVVPAIEKRRILAASFASVKFPGRAPQDCELIRVFVGGALQRHLAALDDEQLQALASDELSELLSIRGQPELVEIERWPAAMPQFHVGHVQLVERIEQRVAALPGLGLAGNAYSGVGIPQCIRSGELAAERVAPSPTGRGPG